MCVWGVVYGHGDHVMGMVEKSLGRWRAWNQGGRHGMSGGFDGDNGGLMGMAWTYMHMTSTHVLRG